MPAPRSLPWRASSPEPMPPRPSAAAMFAREISSVQATSQRSVETTGYVPRGLGPPSVKQRDDLRAGRRTQRHTGLLDVFLSFGAARPQQYSDRLPGLATGVQSLSRPRRFL